jgi:uncharacterized RDD family membrane protein YckC
MALETLGGGVMRGAGERAARQSSGSKILFRRWLGSWIDFVVLYLLFFLPMIVMFMLPLPSSGDVFATIAILAGALLVLLYFPIGEGLWGRTVGKLVTGMVVVDAQGRTPGLGRAILRTVTRLVEVNPFLIGGLPAGICIMLTDTSQRLGDLLAKTYVVPAAELKAKLAQSDARVADMFS